MVRHSKFIAAVAVLCVTIAAARADQSSESPDQSATEQIVGKDLKLEELFPEKGLFGPSAGGTTFSHDGKHAAYLYRPYVERRHGSDLWILDTETGETRRITSVSVMSKFEAETRKVKDDRLEKAKKRRAAKKKDDIEKKGSSDTKSSVGRILNHVRDYLKKEQAKKTQDAQEVATTQASTATSQASDTATSNKAEENSKSEEDILADEVDEKDADDKKAPRYSGIQSVHYSPIADELLFVSRGDVYRLTLEDIKITRLTCTQEPERDVQYLPDGSGYTYMRGRSLMKVTFDHHTIEQLDPRLPSDEDIVGYRLSPDGTRLVFISHKKKPAKEPQRTVDIARYRDRFMDVWRVPRTVSDDPIAPAEICVYLYDLADLMHEAGEPLRVFSHEVSGPRDRLAVPDWSPDSNRVCFSVYEQTTGHIQILEADLPERAEAAATTQPQDASSTGEQSKKTTEKNNDGEAEKTAGEDKADEDVKVKERKARVVYQLLHNGGPTTPDMLHPRYLADSRRIVILSEHTGFRHVHILDPLYETLQELTHGHFEVYPLDISKDRKWLFVTSTKEHPACLDVYRVSMDDGTMTRLSKLDGVYDNVAVSQDGTKMLANYVTYGKLKELVYQDISAEGPIVLTDSHTETAAKYTQVIPSFFSYKNRRGQDIHGMMFKPDNWHPSDRRPLLIYVYGGPLGTRKVVTDGTYSGDSYFFAYYMAKKHGYITCAVDPRGASGYGGLFEKANFEQAGKPQVEDLVDAVKWFVKNHGVDPAKVGIHGWSFGGFQTQMCMYTQPDVFAVGMAGAGPTEWENYNSWYSTGTIGKSREGKTDLKKFSLLPLAKNLKGKLLLIHGMEDPNVLYQDTVKVYRELIKAGKETLVELFLDTTGQHHLGGDIKTLGRMRKYEEFLLRTLGEGKTSSSPMRPKYQWKTVVADE